MTPRGDEGTASWSSVRRSRALWAIVAIGLVIRLVLAFAFTGTDHVGIEAFAASSVRNWDWHAVYGSGIVSWAYPPVFLSWAVGASWLSEVSGLPFHGLVKLGPTIADVALALTVYVYLGWRHATERQRLAGAALVMLGPSFFAVSGYHGQIDAVAILPAVLALMVWERRPASTRATEAGLLIGLGAAIKIVPLLMVLPLLTSTRSWREGIKLVGWAGAIPALVLAPLWIDGVDLHRVIGYTGVPGLGGLSLIVEPGLGWDWMTVAPPLTKGSEVTLALRDASRWVGLGALAIYGAFVFRYRPAVIDAAVLMWLVIFVFSPNFFLNYLVHALPFFIMAGYLRQVGILQAILVVPTIAFYVSLWPARSEILGFAYVPIMCGLWVFWVAAAAAVARRIAKQRTAHPNGVAPPLVDLASSPGV